ncbi:MAG: trehalose-6-phosphate synthase [Crocosphaera sp.]|nr:trehalose-6-phosphate synthase [Crocosphaera sp.]
MNKSANIRFLLVSHRTYSFLNNKKPQLDAIGGVVSTIEKIVQKLGGVWIGLGGDCPQTFPKQKIIKLSNCLSYKSKLIRLSNQDINEYYNGFANSLLWPLCHSLLSPYTFSSFQWKAYKRVNRQFANSIIEELTSGEIDVVWIHDYHLALTPQFVREECPDIPIIYFWHIPFPDLETFRMLPFSLSKNLLIGLLHANLLVFHIESDSKNFLKIVEELLRVHVDWDRGMVELEGKTTVVRTIPLGIDWESWQTLANSTDIKSEAQAIRSEVKVEFLGLAVDRLDYTKGILERVRAIELFLEENPNYQKRFTLLQIAAPSRTGIDQYRQYRDQVEEEINRINKRFGNQEWQPIKCQYEIVPQQKLAAYYQAADFACILPLRDGMNLVAKEYVACCLDYNGTILLSNTAGVAEEFGDDALLVNPLDTKAVAQAIKKAIELDPVTRVTKMLQLRNKVKHHDFNWWLQHHLDEIEVFMSDFFEVNYERTS